MNETAAPRQIAAIDTISTEHKLAEIAAIARQNPVETGQSSLLAVISKAARDPAVDIDKFERLSAMLERMGQQEARKAFNSAVSRAKGEIGPITKNREVDFTNKANIRTHYRHEDFAEIARVVDPVLSRHGLGYRFRSEQVGVKLKIICILFHDGGWEEQTGLEANNDTTGNKNDHQSVGSAATYLQRYTLKIALGLAASNDTDGRPDEKDSCGEVLLSDEQIADITARMENAQLRYDQVCKHFKVKQLNDINAANYNDVVRVIDETAAYRAKKAKESAK